MTAAPSITLAQLLVTEDDAAILDFVCPKTGILLWPHIRTVYLRMAMSDFLYGTPLDGSVSKGVPATRALTTFGRSVLRNMLFSLGGHGRADVCLLSTGIGNQAVDGKLLNRLSDHFALAHPGETITVEDHFHWRWPFPRHNERVMLHAPIQAWNAIDAKLRVDDAHLRQAGRLIGVVVDRGTRLLGWRPGPQREHRLVTMLARKIAGMPRQLLSYQRLLHRIRPGVVLIVGGCYGPSATLIRAARDLGVVTAEYQHGTISAGHDGYNFAPTIRASRAYRESLPEHFLSYGTWWNDRINAPVRMRAVGNPHRDFRLDRLDGNHKPKRDLLILGDGTEFGLYLELARQLAPEAKRKDLRIVIRPHPLERASVVERYGNRIDDTIAVDENADLYASLITAHAVVSELSTGLFEAAGIADKLFMWDTPKARFGFPTFPFQSFACPDHLTSLIESDTAGRLPTSEVEAIWAGGWQRNYTDFLRSCGVFHDTPEMAGAGHV
jgi:hypothetical protein